DANDYVVRLLGAKLLQRALHAGLVELRDGQRARASRHRDRVAWLLGAPIRQRGNQRRDCRQHHPRNCNRDGQATVLHARQSSPSRTCVQTCFAQLLAQVAEITHHLYIDRTRWNDVDLHGSTSEAVPPRYTARRLSLSAMVSELSRRSSRDK